ncbi:MAG: succinylglutamate desuccinylase/aspartoacylase family protein [Weeksellaceae bacterium]|nr:succinylglutamate desuccinylase/aspartoacylase family protein [Weeksellaceae bacterium]
MEEKDIIIGGNIIRENSETVCYLPVAHLPTRTEIDIPTYVYRAAEPGPTVLFSGGLHGDEINGVEIVRQILDCNLHHVNRGMVICVPIINVYGFIHFSRYVPDGKDVNRSFPGFANGSLASKVAYVVMQNILPFVDYGIDFHTGGAQRSNYPQIRGDFRDAEIYELAKSMQTPFKIHSGPIPRSFRKAAFDLGKRILVYEGGETLRFDPYAIAEGIDCATRFLQSLGMTDIASTSQKETIEIERSTWMRCSSSGMWLPKVKMGQYVEKGQDLGFTTSPYGDFREHIYARVSGYVLALNHHAVVNRGDALIHLGVAGSIFEDAGEVEPEEEIITGKV